MIAVERCKSILLRLWIVTGLFFMVLPGTVLGFTNLLAISAHHGLAGLSAAWIQAHGFSRTPVQMRVSFHTEGRSAAKGIHARLASTLCA